MSFYRSALVSTFIVLLWAGCSPKPELPITPDTALSRYLDNGDRTFEWEIIGKTSVDEPAITVYELLLTSQTWRTHVWKHQLTVLVPEHVEYETALLFISGGSNKNGAPNLKSSEDEFTMSLAQVAIKNSALVATCRQTPNQPLYDDLVEDQLISYTLHNFKNDGDYTWPLLFPMVKSAVRAMDAIQEFSKKELQFKTKNFLVSGGSKRGWTTWLTGATDPRVTAIAPMVIDVLNMPVSLDYHLEAWDEYSIQIEDYTKLEIPQSVHSEEGDQITQMVDPYSYRQNLTMPKMIFIGTIDEYWPVDAIKNYLDSIPGENFIQYVPNAGHDLGDGKQAIQALSSFFALTLHNKDYPVCKWSVHNSQSKFTLDIDADPDLLLDAIVWYAESEDRDFRDEQWVNHHLNINKSSKVTAEISAPEKGFKAFYVDLKYTDPHGDAFVESTRMFVADSTHVL